jgi:hypothetical protein
MQGGQSLGLCDTGRSESPFAAKLLWSASRGCGTLWIQIAGHSARAAQSSQLLRAKSKAPEHRRTPKATSSRSPFGKPFSPKASTNPSHREFLLRRAVIQSNVPPLSHGLWLSLVERLVRDEEVAGSNPVSPIFRIIRENRCPPRLDSSTPTVHGRPRESDPAAVPV